MSVRRETFHWENDAFWWTYGERSPCVVVVRITVVRHVAEIKILVVLLRGAAGLSSRPNLRKNLGPKPPASRAQLPRPQM